VKPVIDRFSSVAILLGGDLAFIAQGDDDETFAPEVSWKIFGKASASEFAKVLEIDLQLSAGMSFNAPVSGDGNAILDSDINGNDGNLRWWFGNGDTLPVWDPGQPAPGIDGEKMASTFRIQEILSDRTILALAAVSPEGDFLDSKEVFYLVHPDGSVEFLFPQLNNPYPAMGDDVPAGSFSVTVQRDLRDVGSIDINDSLQMAFAGLLVIPEEVARTSIWYRAPENEPMLVATTGMSVSIIGSTNQGKFSALNNRNVRIDGSGNIYFEAALEGQSGNTIWSYRMEDSLFVRLGPPAGSPIPGVEGETVESCSLVSMNSSGRLVIRINGTNGYGYFLQAADGSFSPFIFNNKVLFPNAPQDIAPLSDFEMLISENNAVAFSARVDNLPTIFTARIAGEVPPVGDKYIWDGGAGTDDWHTVTNGRSNWVDAVGTPWPQPPGSTNRTEEVIIGSGHVVKLNRPAWVFSIVMEDGGNSGLVVNSDLGFESLIRVPFLSELTLNAGKIESAAGILEIKGDLYKKTSAEFSIDLAILKLQGEEFLVEEGKLSTRNGATWFDGSTFKQMGGEFTLKDQVTRFQSASLGAETKAEILSGKLLVYSLSVSLEANTVLDAVNESSRIEIGQNAGLAFVNGSVDNKRTLELKGEGTIEFLSAFTVPDTGSVTVVNESIQSGEGVVINVIDGTPVMAVGPFENRGLVTLKEGGLTGSFINRGTLIIDAATAVSLNCTNYNTIKQKGEVLIHESGQFSNLNRSSYDLRGGEIRVPFEFFQNTPLFQKGSTLSAVEGMNRIEGSAIVRLGNNRDPLKGIASTVRVQGSAKLILDDCFLLEGTRIDLVDEASELTILESVYEYFETSGPGHLIIEGRQFPFPSESTEKLGMFLRSKTTEISASFRTSIRNEKSAVVSIGNSARIPEPIFVNDEVETGTATEETPDQQTSVVFKESLFESNTSLFIEGHATVSVEETVTMQGKSRMVNAGKLILLADVRATQSNLNEYPRYATYPDGEKILIVPEISGMVVFEPEIEAVLEAPFQATVGGGSQLVLLRPDGIFSGNSLNFAVLIIGPQASMVLANGVWPTQEPLEPINSIGTNAYLSLNLPPLEGNSINGFHVRDTDLIVRGRLVLNGAILDMNGKSLTTWSGGSVDWKTTGGKIIGEFKSVQDDLEPTIRLADARGAIHV
jgi:hypothetical protein